MPGSLTEYAKEKLKEVHSLSAGCNGVGEGHMAKLLDLVGSHAAEIRELYEKGDSHFAVEVGDLLVLCHEILIETGHSPDRIMEICYERYITKLKELSSETGQGGL